jgi:hypothetical protein
VRELLSPTKRLGYKRTEDVLGRRRSPESPQHRAGDAIRFLFVSDLPERRPRSATLKEQSAPPTVVRKQPHRPDPVPEVERVSFVLALLIREVDFEDCGNTDAPLDCQYQRDVAILERTPQSKLPLHRTL